VEELREVEERFEHGPTLGVPGQEVGDGLT